MKVYYMNKVWEYDGCTLKDPESEYERKISIGAPMSKEDIIEKISIIKCEIEDLECNIEKYEQALSRM